MTTIQDNLFDRATVADLVTSGAGRVGDAADPAATQWKMESLQVINWGGFEGHHTLPFHPDATMLSGGSGTGKSTLLDAYTALMMPSSVAFNGASNDAGTGRARNEAGGQRTLLTYLRGKQGVNDDTGGASSDNLLRGKGRATWGAVAGTFVDTRGHAFSALRLYFVPATATHSNDISQRMATLADRLTLSALDPAMATHIVGKPLAAAIKATWPEAKVTKEYSEFSNTLYRKLAIGANGDGLNALDLLARIQAGRSFNSVNGLYRQLVLDTPSTFKDADMALEHFDTIAGDLARMEEAERKHTTLRHLPEVHGRLTAARARIRDLDQFGLTRPGFTKLTAWSLRLECDLIDTAADHARDRHRAAAGDAQTAIDATEALWDELDAAREDFRNSGGNELSGLADRLANYSGQLEQTRGRRDQFAALAAEVSTAFNSRGDFDSIQQAARAFAKGSDGWNETYQEERYEERNKLTEHSKRKKELENDLRTLVDSGTRIRGPLVTLREAVAKRLGMAVTELPYVAELIDIRPGEERWRTAVETVLGGDARRIVIPAHRRREVARALNDLNLGGRVNLIDGTADVPHRFPLDGATGADQAGRILGKLVFADHPYAGWLQAHLADGSLNALCVNHPDELDAGGFRVTATGQTRHGIRSAVGRAHRENTIGFSNEDDIDAIQLELNDLERELSGVMDRIRDLDTAASQHQKRATTYAAIGTYQWEQLDVATLEERIDGLKKRQEELLGSDNRLQGLQKQINDLKELHRLAQLKDAGLHNVAKRAEGVWQKLVERKDETSRILDPHEGDETLALTDEQETYLSGVYAQVTADATDEDPVTQANRFTERLGAVKRVLSDQQRAANLEVSRCEDSLLDTFELYRANWFDANLGDTLDSYPDYLRILQDLEASGLYQNRAEWQRAVAQWAGEDLLPLAQSMSSEIEAIKARIVPINDILQGLEFGARKGRLKLKIDDVNTETVRQFRIRLRKMATLATKSMTFDQMREVFADLTDFMALLRGPKDPKFSSEKSSRDKLLDVRQHVEVYAVEYPVGSDTWAAQELRQLGSASGGESQELIAFIIGSALRFRLGDELRDQPRFAPVFLDEGFVKADSQFAGRAVSAWRGLKFQIIVGAPEDKFTGLERHMDSFVVIQKDEATGYAFIDHITDRQPKPDSSENSSDYALDGGVRV
ncbi:ATP-binding protein [Actinopolymorpha pittospori]|uniref:Uncharacterized protein YPO0396 n=1 Tax=Actinopolymorpha pittospori TaxID=648752 RepID=A0A927N443_9ACTN|nr:ATP-binding protein [Actinopolymorpha pittospori]MBE1609943.1 uncharacterized protein YPO0396 [Actinopolymorpha pittospori]